MQLQKPITNQLHYLCFHLYQAITLSAGPQLSFYTTQGLIIRLTNKILNQIIFTRCSIWTIKVPSKLIDLQFNATLCNQ